MGHIVWSTSPILSVRLYGVEAACYRSYCMVYKLDIIGPIVWCRSRILSVILYGLQAAYYGSYCMAYMYLPFVCNTVEMC